MVLLALRTFFQGSVFSWWFGSNSYFLQEAFLRTPALLIFPSREFLWGMLACLVMTLSLHCFLLWFLLGQAAPVKVDCELEVRSVSAMPSTAPGNCSMAWHFKVLWNLLPFIKASPNTVIIQMRDNESSSHGVENKVFRACIDSA